MDRALAGRRILVAGAERAPAESLPAVLAAAGGDVRVSRDADAAAEAVAVGPRPHVVVATAAIEAAVRERLDPLELGGGPPVVVVDDLVESGARPGRGVARRLALLLDRHELAARVEQLESALVGTTVSHRRELEAARLETLRRLAMAGAYHDDNTREHPERVAQLAARLARRLGMGNRDVWLVRQAASLHDIGNIAIPDAVLLRAGRLSPEEFEVVKAHPVVGARVLAGSDSDLLQVAELIARSHHERWDGGGYPDGKAGPEIPLVARLVQVADVFDVLVHERPYKESWSVERSVAELCAQAGAQFDPEVVQAFEDLGSAVMAARPG